MEKQIKDVRSIMEHFSKSDEPFLLCAFRYPCSMVEFQQILGDGFLVENNYDKLINPDRSIWTIQMIDNPDM